MWRGIGLFGGNYRADNALDLMVVDDEALAELRELCGQFGILIKKAE